MKFFNKIVFFLLMLHVSAKAEIRLPALVADHMVLQRDVKVPVWGWAKPKEHITIKFKDKSYNGIADRDGKWIVKLDKNPAGGPFNLTIKGLQEEIIIRDILIGEVWICSGQSNMVLDFNNPRLKTLYAEDIAGSKNDQIRQILIARTTGTRPAASFKSVGWRSARPEILNSFSAAAYFFGRELFQRYNVPVGLINTSWGGTRIEAWISEKTIHTFPKMDEQLTLLKDTLKAKDRVQDLASAIYNGMIAPLTPYAIKGAIWYQGENNTANSYEYHRLLPALIADWRSKWGQGNFPFIFQQLVNFKKVKPQPAESEWAELREAQLATLSKSVNTAMAVGIDLGEAEDIHPVNKLDVGRRLALLARKLAYNEKDLLASGPVYRSMKTRDGKIILKFSEAGKNLSSKDGQQLNGFTIAGADKNFYNATAHIKDNLITVSSAQVSNPRAVRYAWADNPQGCNLTNSSGLPASPFRTDDWPGLTFPKPTANLKNSGR